MLDGDEQVVQTIPGILGIVGCFFDGLFLGNVEGLDSAAAAVMQVAEAVGLGVEDSLALGTEGAVGTVAVVNDAVTLTLVIALGLDGTADTDIICIIAVSLIVKRCCTIAADNAMGTIVIVYSTMIFMLAHGLGRHVCATGMAGGTTSQQRLAVIGTDLVFTTVTGSTVSTITIGRPVVANVVAGLGALTGMADAVIIEQAVVSDRFLATVAGAGGGTVAVGSPVIALVVAFRLCRLGGLDGATDTDVELVVAVLFGAKHNRAIIAGNSMGTVVIVVVDANTVGALGLYFNIATAQQAGGTGTGVAVVGNGYLAAVTGAGVGAVAIGSPVIADMIAGIGALACAADTVITKQAVMGDGFLAAVAGAGMGAITIGSPVVAGVITFGLCRLSGLDGTADAGIERIVAVGFGVKHNRAIVAGNGMGAVVIVVVDANTVGALGLYFNIATAQQAGGTGTGVAVVRTGQDLGTGANTAMCAVAVGGPLSVFVIAGARQTALANPAKSIDLKAFVTSNRAPFEQTTLGAAEAVGSICVNNIPFCMVAFGGI